MVWGGEVQEGMRNIRMSGWDTRAASKEVVNPSRRTAGRVVEGYMRLDEGRNGKRLWPLSRIEWLVLEGLEEEAPEHLLDLTPKETMNVCHDCASAIQKLKFVSFVRE